MSKITQGERCQAQFLLDHLNAQASAYPHPRCTAAYRAARSQSRGVLLPCPDRHAYSGWLGDALQRNRNTGHRPDQMLLFDSSISSG
jgi:hypothetical protein